MQSLLFFLLLSLVWSENILPQDLVGGLNPDFGSFIPPPPEVNITDKKIAKQYYPHCGIYESECVDKTTASIKYTWSFSGFKHGVPSYLPFNITYYTYTTCNSSDIYLQMYYTWYVKKIENNYQYWTIVGNNVFFISHSNDIQDSMTCQTSVISQNTRLNVRELDCLDNVFHGIMFSYERHFNKTSVLHFQFNNNDLITVTEDYIPPLSIPGPLEFIFNDGTIPGNIQYFKSSTYGCCNDNVVNWTLIICICAICLILIIILALLIRPVSKRNSVLPKKK